ncbi:hypothetical protein M413DRAFT_446723 [Hebeloma cylindrosporum]|uniref:IMD domain-containing protein n=1 Tax=Hebeloma cylindrosporum TaxID=76867 RepID=A0A0C3C879_HEBCY|nr:hypothetical protein M413DRAFT_446723 [Hebeloma cylindrosporum h7]
MASAANTIPHADRADIHKSCKSIENLLNVLNEYCEAAGAVVALQKKLAKALRETAGIKFTGEIPANAMNASANIFEALFDVDSKFSKIADKEYDSISAEVKKWFKKLAKEEKLHDEKMASANAKIKQAGQIYEKKSKKKTADVNEEHARYINLINTLGPEVSQEKYNHTLNVTQRHIATTYNVAACLGRLADTEWQKSYECIRRFSPTVGPLGQWRAMCEGGWTGSLPSDLPDLDRPNAPSIARMEEPGGLKPIQEEAVNPPHQNDVTPLPSEYRELSEQPRFSLPGYSTGPPSASTSSHDLQREPHSVRDSPTVTRNNQIQSNVASEVRLAPVSTNLEPPRAAFVDANTGSVRSLSAFPTPPTHFPLPPLRQPQSQQHQSSLSQSVSSSSNLEFPSAYSSQLAESPISVNDDCSGISDAGEYSSRTTDVHIRHNAPAEDVPVISPPSPERRYRERPRIPDEQVNSDSVALVSSETEIRRPIPVRSQKSLPPETTNQITRDASVLQDTKYLPSSSATSKPFIPKPPSRGNIEGEEFGLVNNISETSNFRTHPKYPRPVERTDTGASNGSIVAAMRNRYSSNSGSTSPSPRDLPRIPLSANSLATRYEPTDPPLSPRLRGGSPPVLRQQSLPLLDTAARQAQESYQAHFGLEPSSVTNRTPSPEVDRRWRRNEELQVERRTKEQELMEREKDLEMRARDLERDRARLQEDHSFSRTPHAEDNDAGDRQSALRARERRNSLRQQLQRPLSQMDLHDVPEKVKNPAPTSSSQAIGGRPQHSYNTAHLAPPHSRGMNTPPSDVQPVFGQNSPPPSPRERHRPPESQRDSRTRDRYPNNGGYNPNTDSTSTSTSHASNCGCEACSISKYQSSSTPNQPIELSANQRSEKKSGGGWIRRLSMPVGNAFGLDLKRQQSNNSVISNKGVYALGTGVGSSPVSERRGLFSMDGKRNASTTALRLPAGTGKESGVQEDGRIAGRGEALGRRSYEASGISNRSMTNLGPPGRR